MLGIKTRKQLAREFEPAADYGFFGPESMTWKVWAYPTSFILGFARSVTIEHLDPNLAAAVVQSGGVKYRPHTRYGRTLRYFGMVMFGATEPTAKAADVLVKVHSKAIGHDPVTGGEYDANKPSSQLWIHVTAWHSILYCYEKFGPELQTIDPDTVPRSREAVIQYFEDWRPHLAMSEAAQDMVDFILSLEVALPPDLPKWQKFVLKPVLAVLRRGVISTYPRHMRKMFDVRQSALMDRLVVLPLKLGHTVVARFPVLTYYLAKILAPAAFPVLAPVILEISPLNPITMTPREAQEKYGFDVPNDAHQGMRTAQRDRVFAEGVAPSDDGLEESQQHIGSMDPVEARIFAAS
jgi:uncharacterized protein (DUF2236 family)